MYFIWYGQAAFKIQSNDKTVFCYPYSPKKVGLKRPPLRADIFILNGKEEIAEFRKDGGNGFVIDSPGEYEIKGIFIYGIKTAQGANIFSIHSEGIKIGYLGEIISPLQPEEIESLGDLDVLILPVGNKKMVLSPEKAVELVEAIEPAIIIPSCYHLSGIKVKLESLEKFCRAIGIKQGERLDKFRLKKNEIVKEKMQLVILNPV